jgi:hypothetical protein
VACARGGVAVEPAEGRIVRDAPTSEFDADSRLGTITGLITHS